ncbi:carbonic anhydrase family protein [Tenacibaculum maritimum]|uniref:Putative Carbonic anhydrase n=1 Tax=Tenacibaculum maritimum NCIMB 2154 TaxID=1349785 RepID=A0A2H1ECM6_9FLAO|nr:carbonic anhydrase family protein [Tenacibaculum maritimum]MCD9562596.1 carbonic anhydrase [Tenacibaculum maritimum]MCD9566024.1 carbonic anhydrase [Tenacibaculum maritimum]MCD9577767.1 carbonic anhydrase [Tenacibaculum maritimum]MCD9581441.1 carbonic anhydrase [Tenacibaculum maritimum]MCD9584924.1 carbonic anhydrase [Tenacibaculum maritimum]
MRNTAITKDIQTALTPNAVLQDLLAGNTRYTSNNLTASNVNDLVTQTTGGQFPKAVILSCIDSRVPVEMVFDQTIGDVFVARVAGNFENVDILGSMEYSCAVAGSKLVLVLGHESCGAVKAACDGVELGNITSMLNNITPAVKLASEQVAGENNSSNSDFVAKTVENNVKLTIDRIREKSKILQEMEDNGEIAIVGGVYSLKTGQVTML